MTRRQALHQAILELVTKYHGVAFEKGNFVPGDSLVPVSGKVFDDAALRLVVDVSLDFWLAAGRFAEQFERRFAKTVEVRHSLLVNSGSSANLVAMTALTSEKLGKRRLVPGDEVITVQAGSPTTVNPILRNRLVPVFVDVELGTHSAVPCRARRPRRSADAAGPRDAARSQPWGAG
jgi:CDP-6-deoxy-D-xylo-4-hexulose-3-dehydrase